MFTQRRPETCQSLLSRFFGSLKVEPLCRLREAAQEEGLALPASAPDQRQLCTSASAAGEGRKFVPLHMSVKEVIRAPHPENTTSTLYKLILYFERPT